MATAALYTLLPLQDRAATIDGPHFPTARRTDWTLTFRAARVGDSLTLKVQASPFGTTDADWSDRHVVSFTSAGNEEVSGSDLDAAFSESDVLVRGIVSAAEGEHTAEITARAPFFDPTDSTHAHLISKADRTREELPRLAEIAENRVLTQALDAREDGRLMADLRSPIAGELIRRAIADQVTLEAKRLDLMESSEAGDAYTGAGSRLPILADGVTDTLAPILGVAEGAVVWTGRG